MEREDVIAGFTVVTRAAAMGRTVEALVDVGLTDDQPDADDRARVVAGCALNLAGAYLTTRARPRAS